MGRRSRFDRVDRKLGLLAAPQVGCPRLKHLKPPAAPESLDGNPHKEKEKWHSATGAHEIGEPSASDFYTLERVNAEVLYCINDGYVSTGPLGSFRGLSKQ